MSDDQNTLKLFGVDLLKVECFSYSILRGYIGAVIGGVCGYIFTTNYRITGQSMIGGFFGVSSVCWLSCKYRNKKRLEKWNKLKAEVNRSFEERTSGGEYILPRDVAKRMKEKNAEQKEPVKLND
ncbi:UNVERIFIED_CONTAM: hypothetical protein PYX00_009698 [Menopon gallinae]|uniref:Cytochrome c oxidase assembly protein COX20, mitochondrial n=1 Tax=Menopon gallinae TaxID=328185 RepID=A0AAW2HD28_9NEOP